MEGYIKGNIDVAWWVRQIRLGIEYRKKCCYEDKWDQWRAFYRGQWRPGVLPSNIFFKMVRTVVPRIYFRNPSVSITSTKPGIENLVFAQILERVDNKLFKVMGLKKQIKTITQNAFMFGTGFGKLGFGSEYLPTPEMIGPTEKGKTKKGEAVEYNANVATNMPWFLSVHPGNVIVPAGLARYEDARWTAHEVYRPIEDLKADNRFKNTDHLTANIRANYGTSKTELPLTSPPVDQACLYEIRDKKTAEVFVLNPYYTERELLRTQDEFLLQNTIPIYPVVFNEDDTFFWGVPDSQILEPLQLELNETRTLIMQHRRLAIIKLIAKAGSITKEEAAKLISSDVKAIAFANDVNAIQPVNVGGIPPDLIMAENLTMNDVRETIGFSRNEFGEFKPGSKSPTATEVDAVRASSEIRVDERRDMLADMLVQMTGDMHRIIFNHWKVDQVVELVGPGGVPLWVTFRGEMLKKGQYEVNIDPDTAIPQTKDLREAKALALYRELKQNPLINPYKLTQHLLREMHGVAFDDLMEGLPQALGMSPQTPMNIGQYSQVMQKANSAGIPPASQRIQ